MNNTKINFIGIDCDIKFGRYSNNRPAIILVDSEDGSMVSKVSVNLPNEEMQADETAVKNYSENEGLLEILIDQGILSEPIRYVESGFVKIPICKILIEVKHE